MDFFDFFDAMGLVGVGFILYCYARLQWHRDFAKELSYSVWNLTGDVLLLVSIWHKWNVAAFIVNLIMAAISLYGIYRCLKYKKGKASFLVAQPQEESIVPVLARDRE